MMVTLEIPEPERITTDQKRKGFFRSLLERYSVDVVLIIVWRGPPLRKYAL